MSLDWEHQYQICETPWDKGAPAPPLLEWLESNPRTIRGTILVPGCGAGYDVEALAEKSSAELAVGLDISNSAIELARKNSTSEKKATYDQGDIFNLKANHVGAYDWVWEHTCFCAISPDRREDYVEAVWTALKPSGLLLGVFYLNPYDDEHQPGGGPPHGVSRKELESFFIKSGMFRKEEEYTPKKSYPGREKRERVLCMRRMS
ncbi:MAG: thiopurine S-methyltransferase [Verrucomicrobiales bacterium]|nr:thiopurine S-methyltransferase [Verrucomicrobiales bacterium]